MTDMAEVAEGAIKTQKECERRSPSPPPPKSPEEENGAEYREDVAKLADLLSKLNPGAAEFVPSACKSSAGSGGKTTGTLSADAPEFVVESDPPSKVAIKVGNPTEVDADGSSKNPRRRRNNSFQVSKRPSDSVQKAQKEESIKRTVYVADIDQNISEDQLAAVFGTCGKVLDCRICGDPHSVLRFAFIEFSNENGAKAALNLGGTVLGFYPVKVLPSKTAILPVNPTLLPRSEDEREMCSRTVYCTNIDKKVTQAEVKEFFESFCGQVSRLRLLGDLSHSTRISFVEFMQAESALVALNCSGVLLGAFPIRVSPSKTPVRNRLPRAS